MQIEFFDFLFPCFVFVEPIRIDLTLCTKIFFGFDELPFSMTPNARFLYLSDRHKEALNYLLSGLGQGGGFALLTGEVGTG